LRAPVACICPDDDDDDDDCIYASMCVQARSRPCPERARAALPGLTQPRAGGGGVTAGVCRRVYRSLCDDCPSRQFVISRSTTIIQSSAAYSTTTSACTTYSRSQVEITRAKSVSHSTKYSIVIVFSRILTSQSDTWTPCSVELLLAASLQSICRA